MAVFVDLDEESEPGASNWPHSDPTKSALKPPDTSGQAGTLAESDVWNKNLDNRAAQALACYPVVRAIASQIDLNTLDNLSRTCRSIHFSLISHRNILLASTLRCTYQDVPVDPEDTVRFRARASNFYYMEDMTRMASKWVFKSGSCARDMVSECRRCGTVVCRNCAIKPPAPITLRDRHRRLCTGCATAPLPTMTRPPMSNDDRVGFLAMKPGLCTCPDGVWLCQPCGRSIRSSDDEYRSIWRWRNLYGEQLGGLGTGIGDGDRGVICGCGERCLNARTQEHQIDCDAEDKKIEFDEPSSGSSSSATDPLFHDAMDNLASNIDSLDMSPDQSQEDTPPSMGPGYDRQEIVGIGGIVKKKLVKMVRVGACVPDWEDEKSRNIVMGREREGTSRSWCGWCWRVIPSRQDLVDYGVGKGKQTVLGSG